jgi:hypothetical protein
MTESQQLRTAREHLARAEARFGYAEGLAQLQEGLALLDELIEDAGMECEIAQNVAATYAAKVFGRVQTAITTDRAIPQPVLEQYFKLMLAFDDGDFALPEESRALKIAVVRRLVDLFYEGYPEEKKQEVLRKLRDIAD